MMPTPFVGDVVVSGHYMPPGYPGGPAQCSIWLRFVGGGPPGWCALPEAPCSGAGRMP
jgi:hypothetical protein